MANKLNRFLFLLFFIVPVAECGPVANPVLHPFYVGITGGYGSTTWNQLAPSQQNASLALSLSTPTSAKEGGGIWGFFAGYELIPNFAIEASYTRYPIATVYFDSSSLFTFDYNGRTEFSTKTDTTSLLVKFMLMIPHTSVRAFSSAGVAGIHRSDVITDCWRVSPAFELGFNYNINEHLMLEIGANYTGGYGESELNPAEDYVPFLYSGFLRLGYRF
jgi:hypothetical protein